MNKSFDLQARLTILLFVTVIIACSKNNTKNTNNLGFNTKIQEAYRSINLYELDAAQQICKDLKDIKGISNSENEFLSYLLFEKMESKKSMDSVLLNFSSFENANNFDPIYLLARAKHNARSWRISSADSLYQVLKTDKEFNQANYPFVYQEFAISYCDFLLQKKQVYHSGLREANYFQSISENFDPVYKVLLQILLGHFNRKNDNYIESFFWYLSAKNLSKESQLNSDYINYLVLSGMTINKINDNQYELAIARYHSMDSIISKNKHLDFLKLNNYTTLGLLYLLDHDPNEAKAHFQLAFQQNDYDRIESRINLHMRYADLLKSLDQFEQSNLHLDSCLMHIQKSNLDKNHPIVYRVKNKIANSYLINHKYEEAHQILDQIIQAYLNQNNSLIHYEKILYFSQLKALIIKADIFYKEGLSTNKASILKESLKCYDLIFHVLNNFFESKLFSDIHLADLMRMMTEHKLEVLVSLDKIQNEDSLNKDVIEMFLNHHNYKSIGSLNSRLNATDHDIHNILRELNDFNSTKIDKSSLDKFKEALERRNELVSHNQKNNIFSSDEIDKIYRHVENLDISLIAFLFGERSIYKLKLDGSGQELTQLNLGEIESQIINYYEKIKDINYPIDSLKLIAKDIAANLNLHSSHFSNKRVIIVADNILNIVPFEALPFSDKDNDILLIDSLDISYANSLGNILKFNPKNIKIKKILGCSYSDDKTINKKRKEENYLDKEYGLKEELVGANDEIQSLNIYFNKSKIDKLSGYQLNHKNLNSLTKDYDLIHLATHAESSFTNRWDNYLIVRNGKSRTKKIYGYDFDELNLKAHFYFLSSCNTGVGKSYYGMEIASLDKFLDTHGSASIIKSLWPLNDFMQTKLTKSFYRDFEKGLPASRALANAKRALRRKYKDIHPNYWAGNVLTGNPFISISN